MIKILKYTDNPLSFMGKVAGECYGQDNPKRFKNIAKRCLEEGHGRVGEFADVTIKISGYSAKVIRELYTHIVGTSRLSSSTRYIDYSQSFDYITPKTINDNIKKDVWDNTMKDIKNAIITLKELGVPTEDYTNLLPLAYEQSIVLKINIRALINMFHVRACTCAYWEYRNLMNELKDTLSNLDEEWKFISDNYFVPKCIAMGYCTEKTRHCGIRPLKENIEL
jgi:thymidylate synthase (FAD)